MNMVKSNICGHLVPAIGMEGSVARNKVINEMCNACNENSNFNNVIATLIKGPGDFDGVIPQCHFCTDNLATRQTKVGKHLLCEECFRDWLMCKYDEPTPSN